MKQLAIFLCIILGASCAIAEKNDKFTVNTTYNDPAVIVGDEFRDIAYTADFAKRFKLSNDKVEKLEPGLQAIGFRAVRATGDFARAYTHACYFDLFVNSDLDIYYPENIQSNGYQISNEILNYSLITLNKDQRLEKTRLDYLDKVRLRNMNLKKNDLHSEFGLSIENYRKDLLKGLSVISVRTLGCENIAAPVDWLSTMLILQRTTAKKPMSAYDEYTEDYFFISKIPSNLHTRLCPVIEKISYLSLERTFETDPNLKEMMIDVKISRNLYEPACIKKE
ncbi:MAG: hypothetical protein OEY89_06745 [Gammaproteobacteria bacterium]|nr:hypothetical protein [Gammaproteobacteria bacterium]